MIVTALCIVVMQCVQEGLGWDGVGDMGSFTSNYDYP